MAADLNRVTLVGRLTRDPELRHTAGGQSVASMRLAVTSRGTDGGGNWVDKANFFDVTVFGRQAETAANYMSKGRRIGVDGRLSWREWEAQDGSKRQTVEVVANDIFFLDSNPDANGEPRTTGPVEDPRPDMPAQTQQQAKLPVPDDDDDIPF